MSSEREASKCNLYNYNQTDPFHIGNPYAGIPTNFVSKILYFP
jgi:hypothetical protein